MQIFFLRIRKKKPLTVISVLLEYKCISAIIFKLPDSQYSVVVRQSVLSCCQYYGCCCKGYKLMLKIVVTMITYLSIHY